ncbi:MAG: FtsX-like permease family protein, partial [Clostridiaceae bacterium]|nr:FtsX-like permease family protein [Clostridiaceae bacterium]
LGENKRTANVYAVQPQFKNFNPLEIQNGRFINRNDEAFSNNVVVINDTLAKRIYNTTNVLGKKITIKNSFGSLLDFLIIGVYKNEGMDVESISGVEIPVDIFVPITSGQSFFSSRKVDFIQFSVDGNQDTLNRIGKRAIKALGFKHEIKDAFFASNSLEAKNQYLKVVGTITSILLVIAVITLVVGGIGIVNILLVSVSERYREIGIRKAVGADNSEIVLQFLVESTALTLIGGIIGIFFGFIGGSITSKIINIKFIYEIQIIVFSLLGVILLGVVFGVYPAYKASKLDPVETLRYE